MNENILLVGTKRSGHHAILRWIAEQTEETVIHHNDVDPKKLLNDEIAYFGGIKKTTYNGNNDVKIIYSFEDAKMEDIKRVEEQLSATTIVVIRDIRNTLASLIKSTPQKHLIKRLKASVAAWNQYAYCSVRDKFSDRVYIFYDKWFQSEPYRRLLCSILNIQFTDAGLNIVSENADGSSFDHMRYQGNAQKMDVLNRWKTYFNNRYFKDFYTNELKDLNNIIFNNDRS